MKSILTALCLSLIGFAAAQIDGQPQNLEASLNQEFAPNLGKQSSIEIVADQGSKYWTKGTRGSSISVLSTAINGKKLHKLELFVKKASKESPINIQLQVVGRNKDLSELNKLKSVEVIGTPSKRKGWVSFDFSKENILFSEDVYAYILTFRLQEKDLEIAMVSTEKNPEVFEYMTPGSDKVLDLIPGIKLLFL